MACGGPMACEDPIASGDPTHCMACNGLVAWDNLTPCGDTAGDPMASNHSMASGGLMASNDPLACSRPKLRHGLWRCYAMW